MSQIKVTQEREKALCPKYWTVNYVNFTTMLCIQLYMYVRVSIIYRRVVLTHQFSLTLLLFIDVQVIIYGFIFVNHYQYLLTLMTDHD